MLAKEITEISVKVVAEGRVKVSKYFSLKKGINIGFFNLTVKDSFKMYLIAY